MPKIYIPTPLRPYADGLEAVACGGSTVGEALSDLATRFGKLRKHLYDEAGRIRSFVNIYKNDEDVRHLQKEATPVSESDILSIVPSIAGGSPGRR